jgi:hypothetical protein
MFELEFKASGFVSGKAFGNQSKFSGKAFTGITSGGTTTYTRGDAVLTSHSGKNGLFVRFNDSVEGTKFKLTGITGMGFGELAGSPTGEIEGHGHIHRSTGTIHIVFTVTVPFV